MRAGYIEDVRKARFWADAPEPALTNPDWVKIQVKACGICGSEVHAYHGFHAFRNPPLISGHEFSGVIVEVGENVTDCKVGDRVTAEPHYGCGECWFCKNGKYNICPSKKVLGATYWSGPMGEFCCVPAEKIVKLADNVSFEEGALIEPVANGMYAVRQAGITPETSICVIGCGPIGLGDILSAKLYNPQLVIATDIADCNLKMAKDFGADHIINNRSEDLVARVMELTDGLGVDQVYMAYGDELCVKQALDITRRGGTIHQHAMIPDGTGFPYQVHQQHEIAFNSYNMFQYEDFRLVCQARAEGKMPDLSLMVTHRYPIEEFHEAIEMADKRTEPVVKVMLHF